MRAMERATSFGMVAVHARRAPYKKITGWKDEDSLVYGAS
jgi:hypothetical protein